MTLPFSDDLIMYTVTSDATLRIFFPVLDVPDHLQLHASIDIYSSLPLSVVEQVECTDPSVFWLDRQAVDVVITRILDDPSLIDDTRGARIKEIKKENWDLFLRILADGSVVVSAMAVSALISWVTRFYPAIRILTVVRLHCPNFTHCNSLNQMSSRNHRNTSMSCQIGALIS